MHFEISKNKDALNFFDKLGLDQLGFVGSHGLPLKNMLLVVHMLCV